MEIRLSWTDTEMQTAGTGLGCVARFDKNDLNAGLCGFVGDHTLQLGEAPTMDAPGFPCLPNPLEVFKDNALIAGFRAGDDLLADAMVGIRDKTPFSTRDTPQSALGALAAVGLKRSSCSFVAGFLVANLFSRVKLLVGCYRNAIDAKINAETTRGFFDFRRRNGDRNVQIELAFAIDQFSGTEGAFAQLFSHLGRHLQLARNATLRTDGQRSGIAILPQDHCSGVIANGRMRLELMEIVRLAHIGRAYLRNGIDHVLSGKVGFCSNQPIARVVNIVLAMHVLLKGKLGKSVAGAVELFHRGFQLFRRVRGYNQFRLDTEVNIHSSVLCHVLAVAQEIIAPEERDLKIPLHPSSTSMFAVDGVSF